MSLKDDLDSIIMQQTKGYKEEAPKQYSSKEEVESINNSILGGGDVSPNRERNNPFKRDKGEGTSGLDFKKVGIFIVAAILLVLIIYGSTSMFKKFNESKGADFLLELENGSDYTFKYTSIERETLRINGYTADDIERFEVEERDPDQLVRLAEQQRKELYDREVKPYLDGASDEYKSLEKMTWVGLDTMSPEVLNGNHNYERRYGTYNCNYTKVPNKGSQLFIKIYIFEFNTEIFMTVTSERYLSLIESGNIVIDIEYNLYNDGKILVTSVKERVIN